MASRKWIEWSTLIYGTSSKRSESFCLLIGAEGKNLCHNRLMIIKEWKIQTTGRGVKFFRCTIFFSADLSAWIFFWPPHDFFSVPLLAGFFPRIKFFGECSPPPPLPLRLFLMVHPYHRMDWRGKTWTGLIVGFHMTSLKLKRQSYQSVPRFTFTMY